MANLTLCPGDPVVSELRNIFRANIIRIPEERIVPLAILISSGNSTRFAGQISSLLAEPALVVPAGDLMESAMASLANRRSSAVNLELGVQILSGLLQGMGKGVAPDVSVHLKGVNTLNFNFPAVRRHYIEIARIGHFLADRSFERKNLLFETLTDRKTIVRLVDSVITSNGFEIEVGGEDEAKIAIDTAGLQTALAGAKIDLDASGARHLGFSSARRLAFAFTSVNLKVSSSGEILALAPSGDKVTTPQLAAAGASDRGQASHVLLTREPALVDLEMDR